MALVRRRLALWLAVAVTGVVAAVTTGVVLSAGDGDTTMTFGPAPLSYVVVYRSVINDVPQWEVLAVQRPLAGSDLTYRTSTRPAVDVPPDAGTIATPTGLYTQDAKGVRLVSGRQPGPASGDLWLSVEMQDAVARGLAVDLHRTQQQAGTRCSVFRFADPPSGPLRPVDMSVGHDDLCLASDGLVLAETWTYHGRVVEQRTAVTVAVGGVWPAGTPRPGRTDSAASARAAGAVVTADLNPESFLAAPPAPAGFGATQPPVDFRLPDSQHPAQTAAATVVWSFTRGAALVTVEAGRQRGGALPWPPPDTSTRPIRLPGLGVATTALRSDGPEVRVDVGAGRWVRIRGTVPLSQLTQYAARLRLR